MVEQLRGYTPVATGSMRNKLRAKGLQRARGADDGGSDKTLGGEGRLGMEGRGKNVPNRDGHRLGG